MRFRLPWWVLPALVALALRLAATLTLRPWHDEYFTAWAASLPWSELLAALRWDSGPPLPYLLAKLVSLAGIPALVAARGLSLAAGVLATLFVGLAARRWVSASAGPWASWLFALHPLAVMWAAEGRAYGLLSLAVAWSLWVLGEQEAQGRLWLGLAAALGFGLYTHALGLVWLLAVLAYGLLARRTAVLWASGAAVLSFLPWFFVMVQQPPEAVAWMASSLRDVPAWARWLGPLRLLPPLSGWAYTLEAPAVSGYWQLIAAVVTLACLVLARSWLWALWALPAGLLAVGWWMGLPVYYPGRGEAVLLAPFLALLASGITRSSRALGAALLALSLGGSVAVVAHFWQTPPRPEERMAEVLLQEGHTGVLVTTGWWWLSMRYHLPASWQVLHLPGAALQHPGWFVPGREKITESELSEAWQELAAVGARGEGAGLIVTPGLPEAQELRSWGNRLGWQALSFPGGELWIPGQGR